MNLYNLYYKTDNKIIERKNITKEQVNDFLNNLEKHPNSELKITKIKIRDEEER